MKWTAQLTKNTTILKCKQYNTKPTQNGRFFVIFIKIIISTDIFLEISVNNLLQVLELSYDYETKIIDNCDLGSNIKIVEKPGAIKLSDWLRKT